MAVCVWQDYLPEQFGVLGRRKAFFNHLKTGAAPPKHGHIFMHPWISRSPRWVRGKIARTIAAKASIAAKVDAFEGEPWTKAMVEQIDQKIEEIKPLTPNQNAALGRC